VIPSIVGALIVGLPALILALLLFWRKLRPVFWFALALIVIGLGYLASTGALSDIGNVFINETPIPVETPAP
jgi:dipeptide/tripeptide permease